jgi:hypothetical protein
MNWERTTRRDERAIALANRHYSRQVIGAPQVGGAGNLIILVRPEGDAAWITIRQEFSKHAWPGAWNCSMFRNESTVQSSHLIREAVSVTRFLWGAVPEHGFITFVDAGRTRRKRDPGRCYRKAGFAHIGFTGSGLYVLQMLAADMPEPAAPANDVWVGVA